MNSEGGERFNHDGQAPRYDASVSDERDPIRAGYAEVLAQVAALAAPAPDDVVLELGSGTGNLTRLLPPCALICVDLSERMMEIARSKLPDRPIRWERADLLGWLEGREASCDRLVSTYAVHHLTHEEKALLFARARAALRPGGWMVLGDLMVESEEAGALLRAQLRAEGQATAADDMEEEHFWDVGRCDEALRALGFETSWWRVSRLSWVVLARR